MNLSRNQIIIVGAIGVVILFFILLFLGLIPGLKPAGSPGLGITAPGGTNQIKLSFWGVSEAGGPGVIRQVTDEYSKSAGAQITYTDFPDAASYEKNLLEAFATGRAPDIFMFHSSWLPKHFNKTAPAPEPVNIAYVQQMFPDVIQRDFIYQGKVVALPLYIDTLAFIYNKDIFNAKSIALAPRTWEDFESLIPQLRELNLMGQITKPAAAIGGSEKSVSNASDMVGLLMLQYGSKMFDAQNGVNFGKEGLSAFNFYLQFANPSSAYYTWNDNVGYSIDVFSRGETGAIFNYQSAISRIKEKNPYMNIGVGPMLQFDLNQPVNYSDYWGLAVSYQSSKQTSAWNFVLSATADAKVSDVYLQASGKPPALRSLIDKYKNDPNIGVFARQALTAKSWSQPDSAKVKQIFSNMIESVLSGKLSSDKALEQAKNSINAL